MWKERSAPKAEGGLTIDSDLAITILVTGGQESLGLLLGEFSGASREALQEQPDGGGGGGKNSTMSIADDIN